jgi:hypothetical protein
MPLPPISIHPVYLHVREREEVRAEANLAILAEERAHDVQQRPLQVGERQPLVDGEPLELVEDREVRRVDRVAAVRAPDRDHVDRRLALLERMDLRRRRLRAQHGAVVEEEGVARRPRGMRVREGELVEVVRDRLHLAVVAHLVAEAEERVLDQPPHLRDRMQLPLRQRLTGERDVDDVLRQGTVELFFRNPSCRALLSVLELSAKSVEDATAVAVANVTKRLGKGRLPPQVANVDVRELLGRGHSLVGREGLVLVLLPVHAVEILLQVVRARLRPGPLRRASAGARRTGAG